MRIACCDFREHLVQQGVFDRIETSQKGYVWQPEKMLLQLYLPQMVKRPIAPLPGYWHRKVDART